MKIFQRMVLPPWASKGKEKLAPNSLFLTSLMDGSDHSSMFSATLQFSRLMRSRKAGGSLYSS